jgi:pilus assembly protein CpaB
MLIRNSLLVLGVFALLMGATVAVVWMYRAPGVLRAASSQDAAQSSRGSSQAAVLVAGRPLATGSLLRNDDVAWHEIGAGKAPAGAITRSQSEQLDIVGAATRRGFAAGDVLTTADLVRPSERGFLAAALTPGHRAMTITVDVAQSASGLLLPGDHVDVMLVQDLGQATNDPARKSVGELVLSGARVVAVDHTLAGGAPTGGAAALVSGAAVQPKTVTLDVTPGEAQRLAVASQLGKLELSLRALIQTDAVLPAPAPVWAVDVSPALRGLNPAQPSPAATPAATSRSTPPATRRRLAEPVRILRGSKTETQ